jgi:nucleotide-binding universal stress UspA family protein
MSDVATKLHRILLPLDVSRDSLTAVEVAFDLAMGLGAEVSGLFVEDAQLLAAVSLPRAREIGSCSGISRSIGTNDIESGFRSVAKRARDILSATSRRVKVPSSFRIAHGDVAAEILSAASDADILILGKAGWAIGDVRRPGSTCLAVLSKSRIPVMIVEQGAALLPPVLAVHDGSDAGERAVEFARQLGAILGWKTVVLAAQSMATGDEVLERIGGRKPHLIVLPAAFSLGKRRARLESPVLFVP